MATIKELEKARDEIQAVIDGNEKSLSGDTIGWLRRDMSQSSSYQRPTLNIREYPDFAAEYDNAVRLFNMFGVLPDPETVAGRLFIENVLETAHTRLNDMLYTLGTQETPYGSDDDVFGAPAAGQIPRPSGPIRANDAGRVNRPDMKALSGQMKTRTKLMAQKDIIDNAFGAIGHEMGQRLSPKTHSLGKTLAELWTKGRIGPDFEANLYHGDDQIRTTKGFYFARSAFEELANGGYIKSVSLGNGHVRATLMPSLHKLA